MTSTRVQLSPSERAKLDRLLKTYGTVRNTFLQGMNALEKEVRAKRTVQPEREEAPAPTHS